ncbi:auxin-induced protein X15 [Brachypodium distachyon]|uniref:Uncharacterized protein n=1 Tax=Brachypodium distachyon TaxID=15368 RepID=A0A0Q3F9F4_BRADI|nr:auxin-induced protein X15 [Brachypodium distachyon]KQJ94892.1 hypothetical protein BRADI_3g13892v3 [Brachypodium distachyon]|eukprot:XP_003571331.1 auxin-induced protein X15 [Brachypodium distachyon]
MAPAVKLYQLLTGRKKRSISSSSRPSSSSPAPVAGVNVPRGHFAVYVGERRTRFVVPTACLRRPAFVLLLRGVEEEFGFGHRAGGLAFPSCSEKDFASIVAAC